MTFINKTVLDRYIEDSFCPSKFCTEHLRKHCPELTKTHSGWSQSQIYRLLLAATKKENQEGTKTAPFNFFKKNGKLFFEALTAYLEPFEEEDPLLEVENASKDHFYFSLMLFHGYEDLQKESHKKKMNGNYVLCRVNMKTQKDIIVSNVSISTNKNGALTFKDKVCLPFSNKKKKEQEFNGYAWFREHKATKNILIIDRDAVSEVVRTMRLNECEYISTSLSGSMEKAYGVMKTVKSDYSSTHLYRHPLILIRKNEEDSYSDCLSGIYSPENVPLSKKDVEHLLNPLEIIQKPISG